MNHLTQLKDPADIFANLKEHPMNKPFIIQKNVPMPDPFENKRSMITQTLGYLDVGDSFVISVGQTEDRCISALAARVNKTFNNYYKGRCDSKKFSYRSIGKTAIRIWRIK